MHLNDAAYLNLCCDHTIAPKTVVITCSMSFSHMTVVTPAARSAGEVGERELAR